MEQSGRLKILRILNGYSQSSLASELGVPQSSITFYEKGKDGGYSAPTDRVLKLAKLFDVSMEYLVAGTPPCTNKVWSPVAPERLQHLQNLERDITSLFPKFLLENGFNIGCFARLDDGFVYLLGHDSCYDFEAREELASTERMEAYKKDREYNCLLLVQDKLIGSFQSALKSVSFLDKTQLQQYSVASFDADGLKKLTAGQYLVKFDSVSLSRALAQYRERNKNDDESETIKISKPLLHYLLRNHLIRPLAHDLADDDISRLATVFIMKLEDSVSLSTEDINAFDDFSSEFFKILNRARNG